MMKFIRRMWRRRAKQGLEETYHQGGQTAHLPAFLDRGPRHDLHRARQSAFMRGFKAEQTRMRRTGKSELSLDHMWR